MIKNKNDQLREARADLDFMRNPPNGRLAKFLKNINEMDETVDELTQLHKEKWAGLLTMD